MDLSVMDSANTRYPGKRTQTCHRCKKAGHLAYECMAPRPAGRSVEPRDRRDAPRQTKSNRPRSEDKSRDRSKNGKSQ